MKRPNKKHRSFVEYILKCNDQDILLHRMIRISQVRKTEITEGLSSCARFEFHNGKTFRAFWYVHGLDPLKRCFKEMLHYMRKQRRGLQE